MDDQENQRAMMQAQQQQAAFHMSVFMSALNGLISFYGCDAGQQGEVVTRARAIADEALKQTTGNIQPQVNQ